MEQSINERLLSLVEGLPIDDYTASTEMAFELLDHLLSDDGPYGKYDLSFELSYSHIIDWVADVCPRRNHIASRQYNGPFQAGDVTRARAIVRSVVRFLESIVDKRDVIDDGKTDEGDA